MRFIHVRKLGVMRHGEKGVLREHLDEDAKDGRVVALRSLSNARLIQILQHHDCDDDLTQMVEDELARRKMDGSAAMTGAFRTPRD
jgi:hypothetical protein